MSQKTKEIQLSPEISDNDISYRVKQAQKFLEKGEKVRIRLVFKGRQMQHLDRGQDTVNKFVGALLTYGAVESPAKLVGRQILCIMRPKSKKNGQ